MSFTPFINKKKKAQRAEVFLPKSYRKMRPLCCSPQWIGSYFSPKGWITFISHLNISLFSQLKQVKCTGMVETMQIHMAFKGLWNHSWPQGGRGGDCLPFFYCPVKRSRPCVQQGAARVATTFPIYLHLWWLSCVAGSVAADHKVSYYGPFSGRAWPHDGSPCSAHDTRALSAC